MSFRAMIYRLTGARSYRHALFYQFPGGLRFKLSEGGSPLDQVLTGLRKSTVICNDIFSPGEPVLVHLQTFVQSSRFELRRVLRALSVAGVALPEDHDVWCDNQDDDDSAGIWVHCAFEASSAKMPNLLWCALVSDFNCLHPSPRCRVYLIHPKSGVLVHPYDDRGMDVICLQSSVLAPLYQKHNEWLLDHDRDVMDATFNTEAL